MKMICDHAEECQWDKCVAYEAHLCNDLHSSEQRGLECKSVHSKTKCIPYIDPILKRVQERFIKEYAPTSWILEALACIIKEESEK